MKAENSLTLWKNGITLVYALGHIIVEIWAWKATTGSLTQMFGSIPLAIVPSAIWLFANWFAGIFEDIFTRSRAETLIISVVEMAYVAIFLWFLTAVDFLYPLEMSVAGYMLRVCGGYLLWRFVVLTICQQLVKTGVVSFTVVIVGNGKKALRALEGIKNPFNKGYRIAGYLYAGGEDLLKDKLTCLGKWYRVGRITKQLNVQEVIIAIDGEQKKIQYETVWRLALRQIRVRILPDVNELMLGKVKVDNIFREPMIEVFMSPMPHWQRVTKRLLDIVIASVLFVLALPAMILIAVLVKISSPGPIIYRQRRVGQWGRPFNIYKFRSMYTDAERRTPRLATPNDPRVTPVGRWLRKWRLDELPQLWNVLKGDMSVVGPRPERPHFYARVSEKIPYNLLLLRIKPGLTSLATIRLGYTSTIDDMILRTWYDLFYLQNMSILLDLRILLYTLILLTQGKGR